MAIQKSVLSERDIIDLLKSYYEISADKVLRLQLGSANCFKIIAGGSAFFLKEYQDTFSKHDIEREISLNEYLLSHSFPTAAFIADVNKNKYCSVNGRYITLQEFIDGDSYAHHDLPDSILLQSAEMLGKLHEVLTNYKMPVEMDRSWIKSFHVSKAQAKYDELLSLSERLEDKEIGGKIREDILFRSKLLKIVEPYGKYFKKLTYKSSHGDFSALQYLCRDEKMKAVIDFTSAKKLPAVWEIMRSYVQSATDTRDPFDFDEEKFCEYVCHYMRFSKLSEWDLKYMPYVYLYQLARSRYGYKEYMMNAENKEELLSFAFWRTDVCRMLLDRADHISKILCEILR